MAVQRLYLNNDATGTVAAATRGAWDVPGTPALRLLGKTKVGAQTTASYSQIWSATNTDAQIIKFESAQFGAAATLSGTVTLCLVGLTSSALVTLNHHVHIWVMDPTGANRGTVLNDYINTTAWATAATVQFATPAITSTAVLAGDRLIIEFGVVNTTTNATSRTATFQYGGVGATDAASGGSGSTAGRPVWVEFSAGADVALATQYDPHPEFVVTPGAVASYAGTTPAVAYPASNTDDVLFLAVSETSLMTGTPTGWALVDSSVVTTSARTYVYWQRVGSTPPSGSLNLVEAAGTGFAQIIAVSGLRTTGNPFSATVTSGTSTATNAPTTGPLTIQASGTTTAALGMWVLGLSANRSLTSFDASGMTGELQQVLANSGGTPSLVVGVVKGDEATVGGTVTSTVTGALSSTTGYNGVFFDLVPPQPAATVTGAVALAAPAALDAAPGGASSAGAAMLAAPAALGIGAIRSTPAAASLNAAASLAIAAVRGQVAAAALAAPAQLVAGGTAGRAAAALLAAPAVLAVDPSAVRPAAAALLAPAQLVVVGARSTSAAAALTAPAVLLADSVRSSLAAAQLTAPASLLAAYGAATATGTVALTAPAQLVAAASRTAVVAAALAAPASLAAAAVRGVAAAAALSAPAALAAAPSRVTAGGVLLSAPAALAAAPVRAASAAVTLAAPAALAAAGLRAARGDVELYAAAVLVVDPIRIISAAVALASPAELTTGAVRSVLADIELNAPALLTAWADAFTPLAPRDIDIDAVLLHPVDALLVDADRLGVELLPIGQMSATMAPRDQLDAEMVDRYTIRVIMVDEEGQVMSGLTIEVSEGGQEYVRALITPKESGVDLSAATVEMALRRGDDPTTWYPADLTEAVGFGQVAALMVDTRFVIGMDYKLAVRVHDNTEVIIRPVRNGAVSVR